MNSLKWCFPLIFIFCAVSFGFAQGSVSGGEIKPWGDQGDGSYRNPVLNANYPDIDIEKKGDTWYMISSTNTMVPGMTILESKDLVNWNLVNHVVDRLTWREELAPDFLEGIGGVWAGDLLYHEGLWYCYFIDKWKGLFVYTAKDIMGPWSNGKLMMQKQNWTDPAVYRDYEKKEAYMLCHYRTYKKDGKNVFENRIFKMSWDGMTLLDSGKVFYEGPMAEAAKVHKINDYYYFFLAEWTSLPNTGRDRKQFVLRSKELYGPYEKKIVMEKRFKDDRSACQGSLIQTDDGEWWYMHQMVQNKLSYEGRPQYLIPVRWENDWPVFGTDPDGNGIGNTVDQWKKPIGDFEIQYPETSDEFNRDNLAPQWNWFYNPINEKWSLTDRRGYLRLYSTVPLEKGNLHKVPNIIGQRKMGTGANEIIAKLDLSGMRAGQYGGLVHMASYYFAIGVTMDESDQKSIFIDFEGKRLRGAQVNGNTIWFKSKGEGRGFQFFFSFDGKSFQGLGPEFQLRGSGHNADRIGFFNFNPSGEGYLEIDWIKYQFD